MVPPSTATARSASCLHLVLALPSAFALVLFVFILILLSIEENDIRLQRLMSFIICFSLQYIMYVAD